MYGEVNDCLSAVGPFAGGFMRKKERISWHPAFFEAIQMELEEYSQDLQFISEYQLTKEPMRVDVVIIKKTRDITIKKNIAAIFRKDNIVEYKSPDDHISINDYYQVYAYACLYKVQRHGDIREMTITFVGSRKPRELLGHLKKERGYKVEERWHGVYIISGDILPIQVIDSRKLSVEENLWLRDLDNRLGVAELERIREEVKKQGKESQVKAYYDVVIRANRKKLFEEFKMMYTVDNYLEELLKESGVYDKIGAFFEARGIAEGKVMGMTEGKVMGMTEGKEIKAEEIAKNMLMSGFSPEQIAKLSGLDVEKIKKLSA
jgi:hypothetical protein